MEEKKPFMPPPPQGLRKEELPPRPPVMPPQQSQEQQQSQEEQAENVEVETIQKPQEESKTEKKTDKIAIINWSGLAVSFVLFAVLVYLMFI